MLSFLAEKLGIYTEIEGEYYIDGASIAAVVYVLASLVLTGGLIYLIIALS